MRPEFARAVDPIFQTALQFLNRLERGDKLVAGDQRALLLRKIDEAEAILGNSEEWNLSKYALCAWIDSQLIQAPWQGSKWWVDNCLEVKYFGHHLAHEDFYKRAIEAGRLSRKDSLEVFYLAVVLGFRGFYTDRDASYASNTAQSLKLPDSVEGWCRSVAMSLQLRQGRPPIPDHVQTGGSAKPLNGRTMLIGVSMISVLLIALAIGCYLLLFGTKEEQLPVSATHNHAAPSAQFAAHRALYSTHTTQHAALGVQFRFSLYHLNVSQMVANPSPIRSRIVYPHTGTICAPTL